MDARPMPDESSEDACIEGAVEVRHRIAMEAEGIAEARASADAGRMVESARVKAWIDSIGTGQELPVPSSGR